ncbi:MAG: fluoride efflux transporter CrcB [Chitinophagaceae bacterium]|nr:MAG: fluoride efflux transporter CrcB [Chitinophagaceae bacterium]
MESYLAVFLGGGLGSIARYSIAKIDISHLTNFPVNTLTSNVLSSLLLGIFLGLFIQNNYFSPTIKLLLITGFCGGFSTYSAFTFETLELFKFEKYLLAISNIFLNLVLCITFLLIGMGILKFLYK